MIPTKTKSLAKFPGPGRFHFNFPQKATIYAVSSQTMLNDRKMRKSYRMLRFGTQKAVKKLMNSGTLRTNTVDLFGPLMILGMVEFPQTRKKSYFSNLLQPKRS